MGTNGVQQVVAQQAAAGFSMEEALRVLVQQSSQTNQILQGLTQEIAVMNRQLFEQRTPGLVPIPFHAPTPALPQPGGGSRASEGWQKKVERATCAAISISKTQSYNKWKLVFHLSGIVKPAMLKSDVGYQFLIDFAREVWPQIGPDHFSEERYGELEKLYQIERKKTDKGPGHFCDRYETLPFIVEFYDTAPVEKKAGKDKDGNDVWTVVTFRYVDRVYPCPAS